MKLVIKIILVACLGSCGRNTKEQKAVNKNVKDALEIVKELPTIEKEANVLKDKLTQQKVTGSFNASINNKTLNINSWSGKKSNIHFLDDKAVFMFFTTDKRTEYFSVTISRKDLFKNLDKKTFAPTSHIVDFSDTKLTTLIGKGSIQLAYYNKITNEEYYSASGNMTLEKLSDSELQIAFKGKGFKGNWKEKNYVLFAATIHLNYNFLKDNRTK